MNTSKVRIYPVILSGGSGKRLWPLSRSLYPKQFHSINNSRSLLQETVVRLSNEDFSNPLIICNQEHRFIVAEQLEEINVKAEAIVLEPIGKNTAPAAAIASILLSKRDLNAIALIMPSDHVITDLEAFQEAIKIGLPAAQEEFLVTFGVQPVRAETGYGYIKKAKTIAGQEGCFHVERFVEKPTASAAKDFINEGDYLWNAGIFLFSIDKYLSELEESCPDVAKTCRLAVSDSIRDLDFLRLDTKAFNCCPSISIDNAVMEKSTEVVTVPVNIGWSDVGSWDALWQILEKDNDGNVTSGDIITKNTTNSLIHSQNKLVTAVGIKDAIIIATDDAILVSNKESAQGVNLIVEELESAGRSEHIIHAKVYRPWGWFQILETSDKFQLKVIHLKPNSKISLQRHKHRAEHWVVVKGTATITRDNKIVELQESQSTYIPTGMLHRLENKTDYNLEIIEVQSGNYFGEDDIERFDDEYGRN